jgi:hypothetical protein
VEVMNTVVVCHEGLSLLVGVGLAFSDSTSAQDDVELDLEVGRGCRRPELDLELDTGGGPVDFPPGVVVGGTGGPGLRSGPQLKGSPGTKMQVPQSVSVVKEDC